MHRNIFRFYLAMNTTPLIHRTVGFLRFTMLLLVLVGSALTGRAVVIVDSQHANSTVKPGMYQFSPTQVFYINRQGTGTVQWDFLDNTLPPQTIQDFQAAFLIDVLNLNPASMAFNFGPGGAQGAQSGEPQPPNGSGLVVVFANT